MGKTNCIIVLSVLAILQLSIVNVRAEVSSLVWFGNSYSGAGAIYIGIEKMINGSYGVAENLTLDSLNALIYPTCWMDCHETRWPAFTVIDSGRFNYVVAQDNVWYNSSTAGLSGKGNQLTTWANHAKGAGGALVIEQIWCPVTPSSTQAIQDVSDFWYDSIASATNSILAPCGHAWWIARQERPELEYIAPDWNDGCHPGIFAAYLNQCVFYATLTGVSPVGLTFKTTYGTTVLLNDADALFAQQKAWEAYQYFYPADRPVISNFTATPSASVAGAQTSVTFTGTVTGTNPIANVSLDLGSVGGSSNIALTGSGNNYSHTFSVPASVPLGPHTVSLRATDNTGKYTIARIRFNVERPFKLQEARASYTNTKVVVDFSERINSSSAQNIANYSINNGVTVSSAVAGPDSDLVTLTTSPLSTDITYTITVNNVSSDANSAVPPASQDTFRFFSGGDGLTVSFWQDPNMNGTPALTRVDTSIYVVQVSSAQDPGGLNIPALKYSDWIGIRWTGLIEIPYTGAYTFYARASHPVKLWVDSQSVIDGSANSDTLRTGTISLTKGKYPFKMDFSSTQGPKYCILQWSNDNKISTRQFVPKVFLFSSAGATKAKPEILNAFIKANKAEYLVKQVDLQGRILSKVMTTSMKKIGNPKAGVYFVEISDLKNGAVIRRKCSVK